MKRIIVILVFLAAFVGLTAAPSINSDRKTDGKGLTLITGFEGLALRAYKCPAGVWTIGFGHTGNVKPGQTIDAAEARRLLGLDLRRFERHVYEQIRARRLPQPQFNALVSFVYNCGYRIRGNLKSAIEIDDTESVCDTLKKYVHANGRSLAGLVRRRAAECEEYQRIEQVLT